MDDVLEFGFENIEVEGTTKTPYIRLNKDDGIIEIKGRSIPENTVQFYYHFNRWLSEYAAQPAPKTTVLMALHYMNSSSTVIITRMMKLLDDMIGMNSEVEINWHYEKGDLEMKELGADYGTIMKCPVNLKEVEKID